MIIPLSPDQSDRCVRVKNLLLLPYLVPHRTSLRPVEKNSQLQLPGPYEVFTALSGNRLCHTAISSAANECHFRRIR